MKIALIGPAHPDKGGGARHTTGVVRPDKGLDILLQAPALARALTELAAPEAASRLRDGVRPLDPGPYWAAHLGALQVH